jgi:hypothetical protein
VFPGCLPSVGLSGPAAGVVVDDVANVVATLVVVVAKVVIAGLGAVFAGFDTVVSVFAARRGKPVCVTVAVFACWTVAGVSALAVSDSQKLGLGFGCCDQTGR